MNRLYYCLENSKGYTIVTFTISEIKVMDNGLTRYRLTSAIVPEIYAFLAPGVHLEDVGLYRHISDVIRSKSAKQQSLF